MQTELAGKRISIVQGDLTQREVDAIVNAANESLRGGGGVDGAIHRAAGPELLAECVREHPDGCPTGEVRVTGGHDLLANWVIHAVGPVWHGGEQGEAEQLASCWRGALHAAEELGARSLAFPAISCGVYGYPHDEAAAVAHDVLVDEIVHLHVVESIEIVLFADADLRLWQGEFQA